MELSYSVLSIHLHTPDHNRATGRHHFSYRGLDRDNKSYGSLIRELRRLDTPQVHRRNPRFGFGKTPRESGDSVEPERSGGALVCSPDVVKI
jgi:hypothetical protein